MFPAAVTLCVAPEMTASKTRRLLLWAAATDDTFEERRRGPQQRRVLYGKCIHCRRRHEIAADGTPLTSATLEHIVPRTHGGGDELENIAIACARCNGLKGARLDCRDWDDPTLQQVIETLRARRRARRREPPSWVSLPPIPS